jgi:Spy/CpxP family protein refolding chaperone
VNESTAKRRAALWVAIIFVLGVSLGGVVGYILAHRAVSANLVLTVTQRRAQKVEELTRTANLTPDQRQQLEAILGDLHAEYKTLDDERDAARQKSRARIRAILTEEQKPAFEAFLKKLDEERKRNMPPQ